MNVLPPTIHCLSHVVLAWSQQSPGLQPDLHRNGRLPRRGMSHAEPSFESSTRTTDTPLPAAAQPGPHTHSLLFPAAALYRRSLKIHSTVNVHYLFQMRCHCFRHRINFLFPIAPTKIQINFFSRNPSSITDFFLTLSLLLQMFKYT